MRDAEPLVKHGGVDGAEVDGIARVAIVEVSEVGFRPSLPPSSWTTTRMRPFASTPPWRSRSAPVDSGKASLRPSRHTHSARTEARPPERSRRLGLILKNLVVSGCDIKCCAGPRLLERGITLSAYLDPHGGAVGQRDVDADERA
jgi:hypothetical protein